MTESHAKATPPNPPNASQPHAAQQDTPHPDLPIWACGALAPRAPRPSDGDGFFLLLGLNFLISMALVTGLWLWMHQTRPPAVAVLDVAELYRLKEAQVTAVLVEPRSTDTQRAQALRQVTEFGQEVARLMQTLPETCRCLVLARGSVLARSADLPDLTDRARRELGL